MQSDNELLVSQMQKNKKNGGHRLYFRDKACVKLLLFEKLIYVIQRVLQGFLIKNIGGESTELSDLSYILLMSISCLQFKYAIFVILDHLKIGLRSRG